MTYKARAKSILSEIEYGYIGYDNLHGDNDQGLDIIADAIKRQLPTKPRITPYEKAEGHSFSCPSCTKFHANVCLNRWQNYCSNCGQAIDWSDVEPNGMLKEGE